MFTNQKHYPDLSSDTSTIYGISGFLPQTSFHGETCVRFFLRLQVCLLHLLPSLEWDGLHAIVFSPFYIFFCQGGG